MLLACAVRIASAQCDGATQASSAAKEAFERGDLEQAERVLMKARADLPNCSRLLLVLAHVQAARDLSAANPLPEARRRA